MAAVSEYFMNTVRGRGIVSILLPNSATSTAILCGQGNLEIQNDRLYSKNCLSGYMLPIKLLLTL